MNNSSPQAIATGAVTAALSQMPDVMELAQLFKAAGFDIPANAEADKRHQLRERKRAIPATSGAR